ncbi:Mu-like phage-related protein [Escherichia coli]|nr:Mu-like phage-related protein [Escherichia coli]
MGRRSSIDSLPKEVRRWLERALTENNFTGYAELESLLKEKGYSITRSSLQRFGYKMEQQLARMTTHPSTPVIQTQLPPLAPALAQRPGNLKPLTPGYAIRVSPSVTSSPTSSTTQGNVVAGETR